MFSPYLLRDVGLTAMSSWSFSKSLSASIGALFTVFLTVWLFVLVKRLFFHPLRNIPGPKCAAATRWYEFYYDVILGGTFSQQFAGLHEKYASSIIRISPNHVHINDPDYYNEVFGPRSEFLKAPYFYDGFGVQGSIVMILDPHKHKIRRNLLNPLFTARSVDSTSLQTTHTVQQAVNTVIADTEAGKAINIQELFRRVMFDSLCRATFGQSYDSVEDEGGGSDFLANLDMFLKQSWIGRHFPILAKISLNLPDRIAKRIAPGYMNFRAQASRWVSDVIERREQGVFNDKVGNKYAFDLLLEPQPVKNYEVPDIEELVNEALVLVIAGTDTTTYVTAHATYYILSHSNVLKRFKDELKQTLLENGGRLEWANIRQLPYLSAIVQETFRLSPPVPGVAPRVVPPQGAHFGSHFLPGGTTVSISQHIIHKDARNFPDPTTFNPDRWLGEAGKNLRKWNVAFSIGTRSCMGIHLAYQEIYLCLALFFSRFEMELYDTDASSIEWEDYGAAHNKRPVKVKVKAILP